MPRLTVEWPRAAAETMAELWLRIGGARVELDSATLIETALERAGASDFGEFDPRPGLEALLRSLHAEARLSPLGKLLTHWDLLRLLSNLARVAHRLWEVPAIAGQTILGPWVITGVPRSGSTFLHRLLALDPRNRVARHFEVRHPPLGDSRARRRLRARLELASLALLRPQLRAAHPLRLDTPQECTELTAPTLASLRFDSTYAVTGYRAWFDHHGAGHAYRFHRRMLQLLHSGRMPQRWVLKSPDHVFALPTLLAEYPDARLILTHRDALEMLPSVIHLTVQLRSIFSRDLDVGAIAEDVAARWAHGTRILLDWETRLSPARCLHLHYRDIARRPLATVERLYTHFEVDLPGEIRQRMCAFIARHPDGDYRAPRFQVEDFHLRRKHEQRRFAAYHDWLQQATAKR